MGIINAQETLAFQVDDLNIITQQSPLTTICGLSMDGNVVETC